MDCVASPFFFALYTAQEIINTHSSNVLLHYAKDLCGYNRVPRRTGIGLL